MIASKLIHSLEHDVERLAHHWLTDVKQNPKTKSYHGLSDEVLLAEARKIYGSLALWLEERLLKDDLIRMYEELGEKTLQLKRPVSNIIAALHIAKRHIWFYSLSEGLLDSAVEIFQILELNNRVVLYFDRATHSLVTGFERALAAGAGKK